MSWPVWLPEVVERQNAVKKSKIKKTNGGYLSMNYDRWTLKYVDEYAGEVIQDNLICPNLDTR